MPSISRQQEDTRVSSSRRRINPQYLDELGHFAQMPQGIARSLVIATEEVHIKDVFPRPSTHGPRLDLAQAYVAQAENTERFEQRSGDILYFECDGSFVRSRWNQALIGFCRALNVFFAATHQICFAD